MSQESNAVVSLLDITPTILDWFGAVKRRQGDAETLLGCRTVVDRRCLSGQSLLPVLESEPSVGWDEAFGSQSLHEVTMYYPMRVVRTRQYRLIHNLAYRMPFPIDQDFYVAPTFQDILARTRANKTLSWFTSLHDYYYRDAVELYDVTRDPREANNLARDPRFDALLKSMTARLLSWQNATDDPWICAPQSVVVKMPGFADRCGSLYNDL